METNFNWPGWDVIQKIGSGSFGNVYEIHRDTFGITEKAALKVLSIPHKPEEIEDYRAQGYSDADITKIYSQCLQEIVQEYSLMTQIKGHPNVVSCEDAKYIPHEDGIGWDIYIKMELLTPLMKTLDRLNTEAEVVKLGRDICSALVRCKDRNIIHRDIKPQNIFVSDDGDYKLGDFGIAKTVERTTGGTRIGTYKYMAPEVYNNRPYGSGADVYSLGLVLYWLLNEKRTPFLPMPPQVATVSDEEKSGLRRFRGERIPAPKYGSDELKRIVLKACAYDTKERYSSAAEMLKDLKAMTNPSIQPLAEDVSAERPEKENEDEIETAVLEIDEERPIDEEQKKKGKKRKRVAIVILVAAILIIGTIGMLLIFANPDNDAHSANTTTDSMPKLTSEMVYLYLDYGYVYGTDAEGNETEDISQTVYNKNMKQVVLEPGATMTLPTPTRKGYTFLGWYNDATGESITSVTVNKNTEAFVIAALWIGELRNVGFEANGGNYEDGSNILFVDAINGEKLPFPEEKPTRYGYEFVGWFNSPDNGVQFTEEDTKDYIWDLTIYAQWKPIA